MKRERLHLYSQNIVENIVITLRLYIIISAIIIQLFFRFVVKIWIKFQK